jgi:polyhydroxyalkanoate synthesis regulator phasin
MDSTYCLNIKIEQFDVLHNENNELKSRIERLESLVNQLEEKINK